MHPPSRSRLTEVVLIDRKLEVAALLCFERQLVSVALMVNGGLKPAAKIWLGVVLTIDMRYVPAGTVILFQTKACLPSWAFSVIRCDIMKY